MIEEKGYYSLDKTFARIIEQYQLLNILRQKLPPQQVQVYSKIWNSFSKWCRTQLEQDRIVLVSDTRTGIFYSSENVKRFNSRGQLQAVRGVPH